MSPGKIQVKRLFGETWLFHLKNMNFPLAIQDFTAALNMGEPSARIYRERAFAYMGLQKWDQVQKELTQEGVTTHAWEDYQSISDLEAHLGVRIPVTIVECLLLSDTGGPNFPADSVKSRKFRGGLPYLTNE